MHLNLSQIPPKVPLKSYMPTGTLVYIDRPITCNLVHKEGTNWCFYPEFAEKNFHPGETFLVIDDDPKMHYNTGESFDAGRRDAPSYSYAIVMYLTKFYVVATYLNGDHGPGSYFCD